MTVFDPKEIRRHRRPPPAACPPWRSIGEIAEEVMVSLAIRRAEYWLQQAEQLEGQERTAALKTADGILRTAGLGWFSSAGVTSCSEGQA